MSGVGVYGGYQPSAPGVDYPLGPSEWAAGQTWPLHNSRHVYAVDLNQQLSSAVAFLHRKPTFQGAQQGSNQPVPSNTQTPVVLVTEITDAWNMHNGLVDGSQITVPFSCGGIWLMQGSVPFAASGAGSMYEAFLLRNGAVAANGEQLGAPGVHVTPGVADLVTAAAGDFFQLGAFQISGSPVNTYLSTANGSTQFSDNAGPVLTARWVAANNSLPGGVIQVPVFVGTFFGDPFFVNEPVTITTPNPGTWTVFEEATATQFNSDIRDSVLFLSNVPACRASLSGTSPSIPSGSALPGSQVTGLTASIDNWGAFAGNTWTCPVSGMYLVYGQAGWPQESTAFSVNTTIQAVQSGVTGNYTGTGALSIWPQSMVMRHLRFTAGDTVQLYATHNFSTFLNPASGNNTRLFTLWVSS